MINATSIGSFFYHNIKGQYLFNKKWLTGLNQNKNL
jgi:hypothetical protein